LDCRPRLDALGRTRFDLEPLEAWPDQRSEDEVGKGSISAPNQVIAVVPVSSSRCTCLFPLGVRHGLLPVPVVKESINSVARGRWGDLSGSRVPAAQECPALPLTEAADLTSSTRPVAFSVGRRKARHYATPQTGRPIRA